MWHRLDRILRSRGRDLSGSARCEACGGPLFPDPALVIEAPPEGLRRRVCSPECLPSVWKKMGAERQKLSTPGEHSRSRSGQTEGE